MDEKTQTSRAEKKDVTEGAGEGNKPKTLGKVERAEQVLKRMEEVEKSMGEKLSKIEELQSERILGGESQAGNSDDKPKEETASDYAKRVMSGGLNEKGQESN